MRRIALVRAVALVAVALAVLVTVASAPAPWPSQSSDSHYYGEAAHELARGDGYLDFDGERPPYPVGMSAMLAPATLVGRFPGNVQAAASLIAGALVALVALLAWRLAGPLAASFAAVVCVLSPAFRRAGVMVLADPAAACWMVGAVLAVACGRRRLGAVMIGMAAWVRLAAVAYAPLAGKRVLVVLIPLAVVQVVLLGSLTGYSADQASWSTRWLTDRPSLHGWGNISDYPSWQLYPQLLMGRFGWLLPGLPVAAGVEMWHRRRDPAARLAAGVAAVTLATYVLYYYQSFRFMLPAAALIAAYAAAFVGRLLGDPVGDHGRSDLELRASDVRRRLAPAESRVARG